MTTRTATLRRKTQETCIDIRLDLDGTGRVSVSTGIGFMDHMLELLCKHALFDATIEAKGDLHVDDHHTVEDLGLALGAALDQALGNRAGIARYGSAYLPMDDALSRVAIDLGGRPYLVFHIVSEARRIGTFDLGGIEEFMRAFSTQARMNLHVTQLYGRDPHHAYESVFKGLARALRDAVRIEPRAVGVPSTKGVI